MLPVPSPDLLREGAALLGDHEPEQRPGPAFDYSQVTPVWFETTATAAIGQPTAPAVPLSNTPAGDAVGEDLQGASLQGRWIVRLTPGAVGQVHSVAETAGLLNLGEVEFQVIRGLGLPGQLLVRTGESDAATIEAALRANPHIASFERDAQVTGQITPDDSRFAELWGLDNTGQFGGTADADVDARDLLADATTSEVLTYHLPPP